MTPSYLVPDSVVTGAALIGLLAAIQHIKRTNRVSPVLKSFRVLMRIVAILMAARLVAWSTNWMLFNIITFIAAACVPVALILLCEALLRRHAPRWLKTIVLTGTVVFIVGALFETKIARAYGYSLLAYEVLGLLLAGWLLVFRDRTSLSAAEDRTVSSLTIGFLLLVPFLLTDFRIDNYQWPVRMAGIGVLFCTWLALNLSRVHLTKKDLVNTILLLCGSAMIFGIFISLQFEMDAVETTQMVCMVMACVLLVMTLISARAVRAENRRDTLLRHIASSPDSDLDTFVSGLQRNVLVHGSLLLSSNELAGYDQDLLLETFKRTPIVRLESLGGDTAKDSVATGQLRNLFTHYRGTCLMLLSQAPLKIGVFNLPDIARSPSVDTELAVMQRISVLISERERLNSAVSNSSVT